MRLDILYFLGFNLDDHLPWHSTVSRTVQLPGQEVSTALFERVPAQCVEKGMVAGEKQCMDSAFVKANAWLDSLEEKQPDGSFPGPGPQLVSFQQDTASEKEPEEKEPEPSDQEPRRRAKFDGSSMDQRTLSAQDFQFGELRSRQQHWRQTRKRKPGDKVERARYLSNMTHYSPLIRRLVLPSSPASPDSSATLPALQLMQLKGSSPTFRPILPVRRTVSACRVWWRIPAAGLPDMI